MNIGGFAVRAAVVLVLPVWIGVAACADVEAVQRRTCESLLPVIEPAGTRITIQKTEPDPRRAGNVRVFYHAERPDPDAVSPDPVDAAITCAFGGSGFEAGKADLIGLETPDGVLSEIRLQMLKRFWLSDLGAVSEAMRQVEWAPEARPAGLLAVSGAHGFLLQQLVNAGAPSALYALLALAYSLVYGLLGRINLAFGDLAMLGAYATVLGIAGGLTLGAGAPGLLLPFALLFAISVTAAWSGAIGLGIFRPLAARGAQPLLVATIGVSLALQEFVGRVQGVKERWLPPILNEPHLLFGGAYEVVVTTMQMLVVGGVSVAVVLVLVGMRRSRFGRDWRAMADDAAMAALLGVDRDRTLTATFQLAGALAAVAGVVITTLYGGTSFHMGTIIGLKALVAAIVGGIGSLPGAVLGGLLIGLAETLWSAYHPIVWRDAVIMMLLVVFLVLRPEGLFGTRAALEEKGARP
ncbi:hypothetical protein C2U72_03300 [Prosthecomicrobium hirschii]|uniref:branched-chain amino acid ABC transporter permease n=1 Tax=Prosthecodimorpha hirschii TaxID=665126 RepID=UPI001125BB71|nr:branched-chain amino acid ABC transporter permease [Prosthecomicrobium hirschii]TPQ52430.1 hypothetical protein C2U72_03300 [Prosthecomicrobium hirschii]